MAAKKALKEQLTWDKGTGLPYCPDCLKNGKRVLMGHGGYGLSGINKVRRYRCRCGCQKQPS